MAHFQALIIDAATNRNPANGDALRCFMKKCDGKISSELSADKNEILWKCFDCDNAGRISNWQNTKEVVRCAVSCFSKQ